MQLEGIYDWRCINLEIKIKRREERRIYKEIKELEDTYGIIKNLVKGKQSHYLYRGVQAIKDKRRAKRKKTNKNKRGKANKFHMFRMQYGRTDT